MRTLISTTPTKVGEKVEVKGWVHSIRKHGKITFFDLRDRTGLLQVVTDQNLEIRPEYVVSIAGKIVARPEKLVNPRLVSGTVELQATEIVVLATATTLPFDTNKEVLDITLPTLLDYRTLTLRHKRISDIFRIQEAVMEGFRQAAQKLGCVEIFTPTISASATEGGAEVFKVKYYDHDAFMIQSPQLYKQMMVPAFERVYLTSHAYRAEPSVTSRHLSESTQMDCELAFVDFAELLDSVEFVGSETVKYACSKHPTIIEEYGVQPPLVPTQIPRVTMREAQQIILDRTGVDHTHELDLMPEDEREICRWAKELHGSDFVTITHYPTKKRAFYTMPDPANPEYSLSYDFLFRGVEILSGSQRINKHEELVTAIKDRGLNPINFKMYLQAFEYGMPPEGGFSFGLERMTMLLLGLGNVREASLFPRDMERVDFRFNSAADEGSQIINAAGEAVLEKIKAKLAAANVTDFQEFEHQPVFTSEEAARVRGTNLSQGAKALVMMADNSPVMVVVSGANTVEITAFKKLYDVKDLRMATKEEVKQLTTLEVGSIPPFGNIFNMPTYVDAKLGSNEEISFNAGLHTKSIKMHYSDWVKAVNPSVGKYSK